MTKKQLEKEMGVKIGNGQYTQGIKKMCVWLIE